ncbi:radical SAM protein with 4Fe4S-binding SPASM domain [Fusibacter tunisiensis]|uniref:Radical SAM protein with 4Fe4S-binding SPASM domain n=2 Tax=Fusibacter tunisiensis TaxID=1008308 RepID=A0ABS2MT95_9FIRM|nr:radical SAM protein with 4Fe4S-binding SPASM domain [Fusibacter tunisiensis]
MYKIIDIENDKEVILTGIASLIFNCVLSKSEFSISDIADYIDIISTYKKKDLSSEIATVLRKLLLDNIIEEYNSSLEKVQIFSQYTYTLKFKDKYYGLHFQYGTIIEISKKIFDSLRNKNIKYINDNESDLLYQNNFLNRHPSEASLLNDDNRINEVMIYLILSYECNMKCIYCFEKNKIVSKQESINLKLLKNTLDEIIIIADKSNVILTMYGGEPFVDNNLASMRLIFERLNEYSNIHFRMITNGFNILRYIKLIKRFHHKIHEFVITIDGPESVHNNRRYDQDGNGTFKTIITNISVLIELKIKVVIRVNLDDSNYSVQNDFVHCLNELMFPENLIRIEYHRVEKKFDFDFQHISLSNCLKLITTLRKATNYHIDFEHPSFSFIESCERNTWANLRKRDYCNINNSITIDCDGKKYACNESMGINEYLLQANNFESISMLRVASEHCINCALYLLCLGRCSLSNYAHSKNGASICDKKELLQMLESYIEIIDWEIEYIGTTDKQNISS